MNGLPVVRARNAQRKLPVNLATLEEFATRALQHCLELPSAEELALREVIIVLVSDRRIAELHRKFMQVAGPTDVLTFQHGEIVISVETAERHAGRFGTSAEEEIKLYVVHGLLHLLGFDDKTPAQARTMASTQTRILRAACNA